MSAIKQYLEAINSLGAGNYHAQFILKHGRTFQWDEQTFAGERMTPKECFTNAATLVARNWGLTYVEGYVQTIIPIHHAWVMRPDGGIIDPTLSLTGLDDAPRDIGEYFGVPISRRYLQSFVRRTGVLGMLDGMNKESRRLMTGHVRRSTFLADALEPAQ